MAVTIRRIAASDGALLEMVRLAALADAPSAFGSTYEFDVATGAPVGAVTTLPSGDLVEGFSPDGRRVLYLQGHGPVALCSAPLGAGKVGAGHELVADVDLSRVSW